MKRLMNIATRIILPLLIAGSYVMVNLPRIYTHGINNDELIYIRRTQLWEAYSQGDFSNPIWQSWDAYDQPPVAPYLYGVALSDYAHQYGGYTKLLTAANLLGTYHPCELTPDQARQIQSFQDYNYWVCIDGKSPQELPQALNLTQDLLYRTRTMAVLFTALTIALVTYLTVILAIPLAGILAGAYLSFLTLFGRIGVMGMMDPLLFGLYAITLVVMLKTKSSGWRHSLLLGLLFGLVLSTKFNAGSLLIAFAGFILIDLLKHPHNWLAVIKHFLITLSLACLVFVVLNPFLWSDPINRALTMVESRTHAFQAQQIGSSSALYTPAARLQAIRGAVLDDLSVPKQPLLHWILIVVLSAGIISGFLVALTNSRFLKITLLFAVEVIALVVYLPLNWDRYFLPVFPSLALVVGIGLTQLPTAAKIIWRRKKIILLVAAIALALTNLPTLSLADAIVLAFTAILSLQGFLTIWAMSHSLFKPSSIKTPLPAGQPTTTFSILVPAKHEAAVIGDTIQAISRLHYPQDNYEALILIPSDDYATILAAQKAIDASTVSNIRIIELDGDTNTKAYSLNIGLHFARYEVVGVLDAEDEPQSNLLLRLDQEFSGPKSPDVIQAGVQLVNLNSSWYSTINCLEYFYWFKSVLPFLSQYRSSLIAGNTVFFQKHLLLQLKGWNEACLTEDAELGVRLNQLGAVICILDDPRISTLEESPKNEIAFIKQRSRWDQGFIQVLQQGTWRQLPSLKQRALTLYTLSQPLFRHLAIINMLVMPILVNTFLGKVNVVVALFSWLPSYFLIIQISLYISGLYQLRRIWHLSAPWWQPLTIAVFFFPYQLFLCFGSLRALWNILSNRISWDKTAHYNLHRYTC